MIVVVADSSPLNYLVLIGSVDVLQSLFNTILVPREVIGELRATAAPSEVRAWAEALPDWVTVSEAGAVENQEMSHLDPGERAAIRLAQIHPEALLLIDDAAGRLEATLRGVQCTGTLGVLRAAASKKLIDLRPALENLLKTNFRISKSVIDDLLAEDDLRRQPE
jgi:predicted nucleic acid-binding protein